MMDKGLINLILSPNPVPSAQAVKGRDKRNKSWSTMQSCCGEELCPWTSPRWNTLIYYFGIAEWWRTKLVSSLHPQHNLSVSLIFHGISFHNHFASLTLLLPLFSLFFQLGFHVPLYQQRPPPWLSTTSGIPDSLLFPVINFNR